MAELMKVECDFGSLTSALRRLAPEAEKELRKELRDITKATVLKAREGIPSGMSKARTGIKWGYLGARGAYMQAGAKSKPKAWAGTWEGGQSGTAGFRHHVYPAAGSSRKTWHWAGAHGQQKQTPGAPLHKAWDKGRVDLLANSQKAIDRAVRAAGLQGTP